MNVSPVCSIIIPVFNAENYLKETLKSAISQTWPYKEIIAIDDGSTDSSKSILKEYEKLGVKVFYQERKGAGAARNTGIGKATGDYIQFLDADDLLSADKIEKQIKALNSATTTVAVCDTIFFPDGENHIGVSPPADPHGILQSSTDPVDFLINLWGGKNGEGGMIQPNAWLTPMHLIQKAGPWIENNSPDDDGEFFCRVLLTSTGILYVPEVKNYYRLHRNKKNLSSQKSLKALESLFYTTQLKSDYLLARTHNALAKQTLSRLFWELTVRTYPQYQSLSRKSELKAIQLWKETPDYFYTHTSFYRFITKRFGWKLSAWISHLKNKVA